MVRSPNGLVSPCSAPGPTNVIWIASSSHQPLSLTWQLLSPRRNLVKQINRVSPLGVWLPDIVFDLCEIVVLIG